MTASTFGRERPAERMIGVEEAQQRVLDAVGRLDAERVPLGAALGRVLREDVIAPRDVPGADNSAMDGYALCASDVEHASDDAPVVLRVAGDLPAGAVTEGTVEPGTAMRIMTGAPVPRGADCVAQVEITDGGNAEVRVFRPLTPGTNIRRRAEDMREGEIVLHTGARIGPGELGVAASAQRSELLVGRRPVVAVFSTGAELVDVGSPVGAGQVVNSNSFSLAALAEEAGADVRRMGIVGDTKEATVRAIEAALGADIVLSSGGVSVGAYDFVKDALDDLGAETIFWKVAMKPGKPVVFSRLRGKLYFGLPGNPVSCMVSFHLFIAPALRKATGMTTGLLPPVVHARLAAPLEAKGDRRVYMRVRVTACGGELVAAPAKAQGSGVSTSMVGANGLAILEPGASLFAAGDTAPVVLIGPIAAG
ncbi:MAG: molybdopterin molybdotransferase MoeA [Thermoanaerobaculia bacterium]|nr:molybdopterin molybdotransferase MoeA [Thermoanaerobaculia bacterium]